ncbi:acetate kinase [Acetoanaerobium pronyense]|uniref:Acetate kinase n=1 Tax=Acetoanaerobium pronyense TaxID=1482736 RepID=A0ABS4KGR6_9FIRM|nr:acetate kinase [Acetoanaerobium pronyense]MBP2026980.1 acetate kinase [Acetoanaerobium pronyense]
MKVLVINCGSSSLKYQVIDMENENVLAKGLVERIGIPGSVLKHEATGKEKVTIEDEMQDHKIALEHVIKAILDPAHGAIKDISEITAVGHRVVHGGEKFSASVKIDEDVKKAVEECIELAPLHNPPNLIGINACEEILPGVPMVGVFDTAFHQTMPKSSYLYGLPYEYYEKYKMRKYGFHGTSHKYVSQRTAELLGKNPEDINIITCHLGNGASVTAIEKGKSVDTSMGLTPLQGLIMGTRCGDIDPAIVTFLMEKENLSISQINDVMNKKSGVLGISGVSSDFRDIEQAAADNNERAKVALETYYKTVKKYIGSYMAEMGSLDAIIFTAGLGENSSEARAEICKDMQALGIEVDSERNNVRGKEQIISSDASKIKVLVIPTNEELMIARETLEVLNK